MFEVKYAIINKQGESTVSTDYRPLRDISANDLFDGRLEEFGIFEHTIPEGCRALTDGRNHVWVYIEEDGRVAVITRYGGNDPDKILNAIQRSFSTYMASEYEPEYWGFTTEEEWNASIEKEDKEEEDDCYLDIMRYLRGETNNFTPGTSGMAQAEIAKELVTADPSLLLPGNKERLLKEMDETLLRRYKERAKQGQDEFYLDVIGYLTGKINNLTPGTSGMVRAEIAKGLVDADPSLLLPENKERLLKEIDEILRQNAKEKVLKQIETNESLSRAKKERLLGFFSEMTKMTSELD
jgi:hypothetical protein